MPSQTDKAIRLAERLGGWGAAGFTPGGIDVDQLADRFGTPLYAYHGGIVLDQLRRVRRALGEGVEVAYSLKANPSLGLCQLMAAEGAAAEVASAGELLLARAAGFTPQNIFFAGPGKTAAELQLAASEKVWAVNVESLAEIERLAAIAGGCEQPVGVGLRVNPARQLIGSYMRMGGSASQFGLDEDELGRAVRVVQADSALRLRGLHVYAATQVFDVAALIEQCRWLLELAGEVSRLTGQPLEMIDFGGGFGVPYFEHMEDFELEKLGREFRRLRETYRTRAWLAGTRLVFELGRYLVAEAGVYVCRVVDVKRSRGRLFAVTDGGMHHHLAATGNFGQVFRKPFPILNLTRPGRDACSVTVAGPCCTPLDVFGSELPLDEPQAGDLIGVFSSGAYGYSASSLNFLSHPTPAEVLLWAGEAHALRAAGQPEDVLRGQVPLPRAVASAADRVEAAGGRRAAR